MLEIAKTWTYDHPKSLLEHASFAFEATERAKSLRQGASKPVSARNHCSTVLLLYSEALSTMRISPLKARSTMLVFLIIPFGIALLRICLTTTPAP